MGQILGLGLTHYPGLAYKGNLAARMGKFMHDPLLPEQYRQPSTWPEPMRKEWADDEGWAHSEAHRAELIDGMRWVREELDRFNPDLCIIWGDDQYENHKEDMVPPFSILAWDEFVAKPWEHGARMRGENAWDEPPDKEFRIKGNRTAGKYLVTRLLAEGFDIPYAYKPLHHPMPHAFLNTVLYLDYDRKGFPYAILPCALNSYGRGLVKLRGTVLNDLSLVPEGEECDPPSPHPFRCFDLGAAIARAMADSPWRVALIASSSWSHSFLTSNSWYTHPDVEADKRYYEALVEGDWQVWRNTPLEQAEASGHHELLNWFCLAGAMNELGRKPNESRFLESWTCNSDKVFAVFRP
ncbi:MAG TPA: extradiol ring-cleavage dioxygenase [Chloroflexota bacterium]|nr:extradiol ring-cleavage dioxygenase [Chloroflexota bacterium]